MKFSTIVRATTLLAAILLTISSSKAQKSDSKASPPKGWTNWVSSKCSVTCGNGIIRRTRKCLSKKCKGKPVLIKRCQAGNCRKWSTWSKFQPCDVTCGQGKQRRTRKCIGTGSTKCKGKSIHIRPCKKGACPVPVDELGFTFWTKYGQCSDACGGGVQTRTRKCTLKECKGHVRQVRLCRTKPCAGGKCADRRSRCRKSQCKRFWKVCRRTCGKCTDGDTTTWGKFRPCSVTCGVGMRSRFKGSIEQKVTCILPECTFPVDGYTAWSNYGKCSAKCGGGIQKRTRSCRSEDCTKHDTEVRNCRINKCAAKCKNKIGARCKKLKNRCKEAQIARNCNLTCKKCSAAPNWSAYGPCNKKCGAGLKTRTKGKEKQSISCFGNECDTAEWADWSDWSSCTKSCGVGMRQRARTCTVENGCATLVGDRVQQALCNVKRCSPTWQDWSEWSDCDQICGGGATTRRRTCTAVGECGGDASQTKLCNTNACATWNDWSLWSECNAPCGGGTQSRARGCTITSQCNLLEGKSEETKNCNEYVCPLQDDTDTSWSECSKSCGEGTRNRVNCTSGVCIKEFEGCNEKECAKVQCSSQNLFQSNRYGSEHACCNNIRSVPEATCGRREVTSQKRVIGGVNAKKGQWPWMVAVQMTAGFCAGSIISKNFILSAAHCFAHDSGKPINTTHWRILPRILRLTDVVSTTAYKIKTSFIHPDYNFPKADIALVQLTEDLVFGEIQPICLPWGERPAIDSTCYVTGWGVSTTPNTITNDLQELGILNFDRRVCIESYNKSSRLTHHVPFLTSNQGYLCAGSLTRQVDSCSGDSGGPLVCQRCNSCTWYIAGIVSFGPNPCAIIGTPGIYSNVLYYEDWILKTTGIPKHSVSCPDY